jgi:hypothetical protein
MKDTMTKRQSKKRKEEGERTNFGKFVALMMEKQIQILFK